MKPESYVTFGNVTRRKALPMTALLAGSPAIAMAPFALIMLPIIGQSIANLVESRRNEQLQTKLASAQLAFQWAAIQMQAGQVEAAHVSYKSALATLGVVARDADGYGTMMAVDRGRIYIERNGIGGHLTPDEVRMFDGFADEGKPIPVPVEPDAYRSRLDRDTSRMAAESAAKPLGMSADTFLASQSIAGMRRFSSGRTPSYGGDRSLLLTNSRSLSTVADGKVGYQIKTYAV